MFPLRLLWRTAVVSLIVVGSGCGGREPTAARAVPLRIIDLQCGDNRVAVTVDGDTARVTMDDRTIEMRQVVSASGARYEMPGNPGTSFWSRGERATLQLEGGEYPECRTSGFAMVAVGNEPGWRLDIANGRLSLLADYGETRVSAALPPAVAVPGGRRYELADRSPAVAVHLLDALCRDTMTGMPRPHRVELLLGGRRLDGCGGDPVTLLLGSWVATEVSGTPLGADSQVSLAFTRDGRVAGTASCNSLTGTYALTGEGLRLGPLALTRKACVPEIVVQESLVADVLIAVARFDRTDAGGIVLHTDDGRHLSLARRPR